MKKSAALVTAPPGVSTRIFPEPTADGTVAVRLVGVAALTGASRKVLNFTLSLMGAGSKLVPVMAIDVPMGPMVGVKLVMVGAPPVVVTTKLVLLVAEPPCAVTLIVPVVAPAGTLVTMELMEDEVTVAVTPLNVTVFWLGVALKPVPERVTAVLTGPLPGVKSMMSTALVAERWMERMLPTAS
jgi:hypothetical protein